MRDRHIDREFHNAMVKRSESIEKTKQIKVTVRIGKK